MPASSTLMPSRVSVSVGTGNAAGAVLSSTTKASSEIPRPVEAGLSVPVRSIRMMCVPSGRPSLEKTVCWKSWVAE